MSQHRRKITIRVTAQTAFHLEELARKLNVTEGAVVDALITAYQTGKPRVSRKTTRNKP